MAVNPSLDSEVIQAHLDLSWKLVVFNSTASTNDVAWEYAKGTRNKLLAVFAEHQSKGRGRRSNSWLAGRGESLLCSVLLRNSQIACEILTLASSIAVAEGIGFCGEAYPRIKWPNDVLVSGKKIAGILVESKPKGDSKDYVIGFGVNCHQSSERFSSDGLENIATSLDIEKGQAVDRNQIAARILNRIDCWLKQAGKNQMIVIDRWRELSSQLGTRVKVKYKNHIYCGNCINVDPIQGLVLQLDGGGVRMFDAAHSSIVKDS